MMDAKHMPSRRERILASAEIEFAVHGFSGARVERIAAAASVNKQLLFHYFKSKAGLYQAVSDSFFKRFDLDTRLGRTPAEQLRSLVDQLAKAAYGHRALLHDQWRSKAVGSAMKLIENGQRSGHFRDDADAESVAEVIVAATLGISSGEAETGNPSSAVARFADSLVQMVVEHCSWH
jgi:AcrR family transcriptional regulator